jgi:hypothetical protein
MPNWCFSSYVFEGKKEEIADLHKKLQSLTELPTPLVENDFGKLWLGCVVTLFGGDWNVINCHGNIDSLNEPKETILSLTTSTAWSDIPEVWDFVLKQYPSVKYYFCAEESGNCYYSTNDKEGKFFSDRFIVEQDDADTEYYSDESELFEDIASRTFTSITSRAKMDDAIIQYNAAHKEKEIYVNEYTVI